MRNAFPDSEYTGLLMIGDPHVEGRVPGFRKDEYPRVVLNKLRWCLDYATEERLLPVILGDLFHLPRDNPNWILSELLELLDREIIGVYGNHDVRANELTPDDSLNVIVTAGRMRLLDSENVFRKTICGQPVVIGGTPWGQPLPEEFTVEDEVGPLVFWICHDDLIVPGYELLGRIEPREIPGVDVVINGHVHHRLQSVRTGKTLWMTPGNISRRIRNGATRSQVPAVLRIDIAPGGWTHRYVEVPHRPFDEVFHEMVNDGPADEATSAFVTGLAELQSRRTETADVLTEFLDRNLGQFDDEVASQIRNLAERVSLDG